MSEVNFGDSTLSIKDPETGEMYVVGRADLRGMVADIAKTAGPEFSEVPQELRALLDGDHSRGVTLEAQDVKVNQDVIQALALKDELAKTPTVKPSILEVGERSALKTAPRPALRTLNRKERRANEKRRRSKVFQKAEAKRLEPIRKKMQAQLDEQKRLQAEAALIDVPFADPRHIGKIARVFAPVDQALDSFEDGEIACMEDGTPLMWVTEEGTWFPAVDCLRSIIETYAKLGHVHGWSNHNAGLTHLANLLEAGKPIHKHDVDAARKTVEWMKYCTLTITPRQFTAEAVEVQIASELRDSGHAPELTDADMTRDAAQ